MMSEPRFRTEALEHHYGQDGLGPVFGHEQETRRPARSLTERVRAAHTALRDLGRRERVPVCFQTQISDCGPACLVMTLRRHGVDVTLDEIRAQVGSGRAGASARRLLDLARERGVNGRGVRTNMQGLRRLTPGAILFWNFNHFVVLERATESYVDVVDPAFGRRRLTLDTVAKSFTGVALEFEPPIGARRRPLASTAGGVSPWQQLRHFLPRGRELAGIGILSMLLMGFEFVLPVTLSFLVGHVVEHRLRNTLWLTGAVLAAASVVFLVTQLARAFVLTRRQSVIDKRMTWGVVEHLTALPYDFFTLHSSGDLALRVRTSSTVNQVLSLSALSAVFDSLLITGYLVAIIVANTVLACVVITLIAAQVGVMALTWRRQAGLSHEVLERQTEAQSQLVEMLESITTLKAAGVEGAAAERWSHVLVHEINKRLAARRSLAVSTAVSRFVQFSAPLVVVVIGVARVLSGHDSLGATLAFMALTTALFAPLESVFDTAAQLAAVRPALARLDDVLRTEPEPRGRAVVAAEPGQAAAVSAKGVSFTYRGASRPALVDAELMVRPGEFTAVLGRSGSGKSTLGMLLAGLYSPDAGTVRFDGEDVALLDRPGYRRQIGYINQNAHLFGASIRDNIAFGTTDVDHADLVEAVRLARVHEEIAALPMGYETLVSPGGHGLSGGQRQRIVLARALARKPRLLILDEATSALDPALEREIFLGLMEAGITVVAIAHRLTVLDRADQVLVVRDGRIVESGSPASLRAAGGEFLCLA
ncbi:peptidase domain-containing ABC transporter [Streptomyces sp. NPDC058683]|uniref:peptidase domain-containing ABC transporter n=1 Tax=Streptomyces sp. NPDC058683 TaxID=3346597 RepID=UPI0036589713